MRGMVFTSPADDSLIRPLTPPPLRSATLSPRGEEVNACLPLLHPTPELRYDPPSQGAGVKTATLQFFVPDVFTASRLCSKPLIERPVAAFAP